MRILLVYPQNPDTFWSFKHVLRFVSKRSTFPPLGLLTIAAMLPPDWQLKLVDLNVEPPQGQRPALGRLRHDQRHDRAQGVGARNRRALRRAQEAGHRRRPALHHRPRGLSRRSSILCWAKPRTSCRNWSPTCARAPSARNTAPPDRPDITRVPAPRWDLINLKHYVTMAVQFSRGCPYRLRVLRHHRHERARAPHQDPGPADRGTRGAAAARAGKTWCSSWTTISSATRSGPRRCCAR